jgi:hypothetical protein
VVKDEVVDCNRSRCYSIPMNPAVLRRHGAWWVDLKPALDYWICPIVLKGRQRVVELERHRRDCVGNLVAIVV